MISHLLKEHQSHSGGLQPYDLITSQSPHFQMPLLWALDINMNVRGHKYLVHSAVL